jgi:hypothetical protein
VSNDVRENNEVFTANQARAAGFQTRNVMADDFGYEVPVEAVPLPSSGRLYPVDSPLHRQETLDIRAMTAREEDILTSRSLIKKGTVITHLIKSCLVNKTINVNEMIVGDRNAIMTALRVTGYGSEYSVEVDCPTCGEKSKQDFQLTELPIKRLGIDPVAEGANLFELKLPITKKTVHFRFMTGEDESQLTIQMERAKKQGASGENLVTTRLKHQIVAVEGIKDRSKINIFIGNMPARDSLALRKHIDKNEPGLDMKAWMDCPSCMESTEVRLPMGASFFWPDTE